MAIRDIFKVSWKTFFNPKGWIDYENLKTQNRTIFTVLRALFTKQKPERVENFQEAKERLNLTNEDIHSLKMKYFLYAMIFLLIGVLIFAYAFFLLFKYLSIAGWLLALAASAYCFAQAFRYHFWSFQMSQQKLGATYGEWKHYVLGEKGNPHD